MSKSLSRDDVALRALTSFLFVGYVPWAPGSFASVVMAGLLYVAWRLVGHEVVVGGSLGLLAFVGSVALEGWARRQYGCDDAKQFVLDEVCGMSIAGLPVFFGPGVESLGIALFFFRVFDVLKPFPVRQLEAVPRAGIALDDVMAAIYANGCTALFFAVVRVL